MSVFRMLAVALVAMTAVHAPALAQSEADVRSENQALRARVRDLELELAAARGRIAELEKQIARLQAEIAAGAASPLGSTPGGGVPPKMEPPATLDETIPTSSPRTLLRALQADYEQQFAELSLATPREQTAYMRALERWVAATNRRYRAPIDWLVQLNEIVAVGDRAAVVRLTALDPGTGNTLGDPFTADIPLAQFRRLEQTGAVASGEPLRLRGTLVPDVRVNGDRTEAGTFDQPRFVGPYCELGFGVLPTSLARAVAPVVPAPAAAPPPNPPAEATPPAQPVPPTAPVDPRLPVIPR